MKLLLKNSENFTKERINIFCKEKPCLDTSWHYHAQYELLYISKSRGIRFVGDSVSRFSAGDLVLVGAYLPHLWRNDADYYEPDSPNDVRTVVLKFSKDFIGSETFSYPEFSMINKLLETSKYGVSFGKSVSLQFHNEIMEIVNSPRPLQIIKLLNLLHELSLTNDMKTLSSTDMRQYTTETSHRLDAVIKYISDNYSNSMTLKDIAGIACMTTNSFCRFFKKMTNKSFTQFLNEVRVRNAARLLLQEDLPVTDVCYKVGYNSITNFYKQFKHIMGCTPNNYRQSTAMPIRNRAVAA